MAMVAKANTAEKDSTTFRGYLYNQKYDVFIVMDFYHNNVMVPQQEIYGAMSGYFGDREDGRMLMDALLHTQTLARRT